MSMIRSSKFITPQFSFAPLLVHNAVLVYAWFSNTKKEYKKFKKPYILPRIPKMPKCWPAINSLHNTTVEQSGNYKKLLAKHAGSS